MRKTLVRSLLVLTVCVTLSGCASTRTVILHPIEPTDIYRVEKGQSHTPVKSGYFLSDFWLKEVGDMKVEQIKKQS